jgi:hypothetical protein
VVGWSVRSMSIHMEPARTSRLPFGARPPVAPCSPRAQGPHDQHNRATRTEPPRAARVGLQMSMLEQSVTWGCG